MNVPISVLFKMLLLLLLLLVMLLIYENTPSVISGVEAIHPSNESETIDRDAFFRNRTSVKSDPNEHHHHHHHHCHNTPTNFAVIVSTSRYWFNYRHQTNALQLYQFLKVHGGFDDDHIVLMMADDDGLSLNPRNPVKNQIYNTAAATTTAGQPFESVYTDETVVDVRGDDVTVDHFLNVLTGHDADRLLFPRSRSRSRQSPPTLHPHRRDSGGNLLLYLTGHGGDSFLKFRDTEELTSSQLASVLKRLSPSRFARILVIADTCQAFTLGNVILSSPNNNNNSNRNSTGTTHHLPQAQSSHVTVIGSAKLGESSYAHHQGHFILGLAVIEKYTHYMLQHLTQLVGGTSTQQQQQSKHHWANQTLYQVLVQPFSRSLLGSNVDIDSTMLQGANQTLSSFFLQSSLQSRYHSETTQQSNPPQPRLLLDAVADNTKDVSPLSQQRRKQQAWTLGSSHRDTAIQQCRTPARLETSKQLPPQHHRTLARKGGRTGYNGSTSEPDQWPFALGVILFVASILISRRLWT